MNLLTDPVFRIQGGGKDTTLTLPALMEALGQDEVDHIVGIQRHQLDAFHVFLCQLAGLVLARSGQSNPVQTEEYWRRGLRDLAGAAGDDAWTLVVDNMSRPAFLQPPLPPDDHTKLKPVEPTPYAADAMDLLVTAKNHDVKRARAIHSGLDNWVYALVSLQTMGGYDGSGLRGIARMNSGSGNRSIVELTRTRRLGGRWVDAVVRLLQHREDVLTDPYGYDPDGLPLVWLEPWDGKESLPLSRLDPIFIECCRRVRLKLDSGSLQAFGIPSEANRIDAKDLKGVVGDAWLPIDMGGGSSTGRRSRALDEKALTFSAQGITPEHLRRIIFEDQIRLTALQRPVDSWEGGMWLSVTVLVRGKGKTEGFHERHVPIPPHVRPRLFGPRETRDRWAELARTAIEYAAQMQRNVLRTAVFVFMQAAPDKVKFGDDTSQAWWTRFARRFEALWSTEYFSWLWSVPDEQDQQEALTRWVLMLRDFALLVLGEAMQALPDRQGRRWRARVHAERAFWGALYHRNNFPWLKEERDANVSSR